MRAERRHVRRHETLAAARWLTASLALTLAGCGGINLRPDASLPPPLMQPLPTSVALVLPAELRNYVHKETRWGTDWKIELGPGHMHLYREVFKDSFRQVSEFKDLAAAQADDKVKAIFEPTIDQYSFVTDRDTGGRYFAVTVRYRINLYTPHGDKLDTLTLTGYGSALAKGMSNGRPLERATLAAMRDAAAKFLVQFPGQPPGQALARDEALTVQPSVASADGPQIEAVPIQENPDADPPQVQLPAAPAVIPAPAPAVPGATPPQSGA